MVTFNTSPYDNTCVPADTDISSPPSIFTTFGVAAHTGQNASQHLGQDDDRAHLHTGVHGEVLIDADHPDGVAPPGPVHEQGHQHHQHNGHDEAPGQLGAVVDQLGNGGLGLEVVGHDLALALVRQEAVQRVLDQVHHHVVHHQGAHHLADAQFHLQQAGDQHHDAYRRRADQHRRDGQHTGGKGGVDGHQGGDEGPG